MTVDDWIAIAALLGFALVVLVREVRYRAGRYPYVPATPRALRRAQRRQRADLRRALNRK